MTLPPILHHTFIHADRVGAATERTLWRAGVHTWDAFIKSHRENMFPIRRLRRLVPLIQESRLALQRRNLRFFSQRLPPAERWRLYPDFADQAAFIDIETTGLAHHDEITVIGLFDGEKFHVFVRGQNLDDFPRVADRYPLLVSYNGATFDLPFMRWTFAGFEPVAHLDLRYPLRRLGHTGGLKQIECAVGIRRPVDLCDIDGFEAIRLWNEYNRGRPNALDRLIAYCRQDTMNLEPLAAYVIDGMFALTGLPSAEEVVMRTVARDKPGTQREHYPKDKLALTRRESPPASEEHPSRCMSESWLVADAPGRPRQTAAYTGKWMPRVPVSTVDEMWKRVAEATRAGRLGTGAKVSTLLNNRFSPFAEGADTHMICVYTGDCRDSADVVRVLVELRRLGFDGRMSYKEDGATLAGVRGSGAALYVAQPGAVKAERRREPLVVSTEHAQMVNRLREAREFLATQGADERLTEEPRSHDEDGQPECAEITPDALQAFMDKKIGPDGRITKSSYAWTARILKELGFCTLEQVEKCIRGYDDNALSLIASGSRQGQMARFEYMLVAGMGENYCRRRPFEGRRQQIERFKKHGIDVREYDPMIDASEEVP